MSTSCAQACEALTISSLLQIQKQVRVEHESVLLADAPVDNVHKGVDLLVLELVRLQVEHLTLCRHRHVAHASKLGMRQR